MIFARVGRSARGTAYFVLTCILAAMLLIARFRNPPEVIFTAQPGQDIAVDGLEASAGTGEAASFEGEPTNGQSAQAVGLGTGQEARITGVEDIIAVHVAGCVAKPGLYELKLGARVNDALLAAGGMTKLADSDSVNIALPVRDGQQVYIPARAAQPVASMEAPKLQAEQQKEAIVQVQTAQPAPPPDRLDVTMEAPFVEVPQDGAAPVSKVDINSASIAELDTLPGIGPSTAAKIIEYRDKNGPFASIEQLMDVSGIGPSKYEAMREMVVAGR